MLLDTLMAQVDLAEIKPIYYYNYNRFAAPGLCPARVNWYQKGKTKKVKPI